MFNKPKKPTIPQLGSIVQKSDFTTIRHADMPGAHHINFPGGPAKYPGKFQKPKMVKPHKRF